MDRSGTDPKQHRSFIDDNAIDDLHRVVARLDALEVRLSVLSVQMQYDDNRFQQRTRDLTRELGNVNALLENILVFGN